MMTIDILASQEGAQWIDHTENLLLNFDATMFPEEKHLIYTTSDIDGDITYQDEHEAYLFNSVQYFEGLKNRLVQYNIPVQESFYEVQRTAVALSAYATRLRAWELFAVPLRTLPDVCRDERIPWDARRMLRSSQEVQRFAEKTLGARRNLPSGIAASRSIDLTIVATLANYAYRNGLPTEWLRPFILT